MPLSLLLAQLKFPTSFWYTLTQHMLENTWREIENNFDVLSAMKGAYDEVI
jgi:hypothetical protein